MVYGFKVLDIELKRENKNESCWNENVNVNVFGVTRSVRITNERDFRSSGRSRENEKE